MVETGGPIQIFGLQPLVALSGQPLCFQPSFGVLSFWFHLAALSFASIAANKLANGLVVMAAMPPLMLKRPSRGDAVR